MKPESLTAPFTKLQRNEVHTEHKHSPYRGSQMSIALIHTLQISHIYIAELATTNKNERYQLTEGRLRSHDAACELKHGVSNY